MVGERHDGANHDVQAVDFAFQAVVQEGASQPESGIVDEEVDGSQVRLLSIARASHVEAGCDPRQLQSAQDLELYLRVSFFVLSDAREIALRGQVERLYRRLMGPAPDLAALRRDVAAL